MINDEKISSISEMLDVLGESDITRKVDVTFIRKRLWQPFYRF